MVASWTLSHGREEPFPQRGPVGDDLDGLQPMFLAAFNAHVPSDAEIWPMIRLLPPVREQAIQHHDLLTRLTQLASTVIAIRAAVVAVGGDRAMDGMELHEALRPLAALGQRLCPIFLQMWASPTASQPVRCPGIGRFGVPLATRIMRRHAPGSEHVRVRRPGTRWTLPATALGAEGSGPGGTHERVRCRECTPATSLSASIAQTRAFVCE
jgi:hypothetical protein